MATVEEVFKKYEICYIYNESFSFYKEGEFTREDAEKFCDRRNQCKGGYFVIHPKGEYQDIYELNTYPVNGHKKVVKKPLIVERPILGDYI
jgi:hypothetical protein